MNTRDQDSLVVASPRAVLAARRFVRLLTAKAKESPPGDPLSLSV